MSNKKKPRELLQLDFHCTTLTPMFINGVKNGANASPELRANSVKGMLRYWWRAVNYHLTLIEMKKYETMIFGGGGEKGAEKSKVGVDIEEGVWEIDKSPLLPHRDQNWRSASPAYAVLPESTFWISLTLWIPEITVKVNHNGREETMCLMNAEKLQSLMIVWATLGGLGRRTRRGMGAFRIDGINKQSFIFPSTLPEILLHLNQVPISISNQQRVLFTYNIPENKIEKIRTERSKVSYPFIETIQMGAAFFSSFEMLREIGDITSKLLHESVEARDRKTYEKDLGQGSRERLASPVYINTTDGETLILTKLHAQYNDPNIERIRQNIITILS